MVIFLFLRSAAGTVIPSVAVPLSLVGTFGIMYLAGFSINSLTLMALTIATGFVVDDAIVMIENIARHIEQGMAPMDAALKAAGELGFTIISMTFSLIAVLIPLLFMGDVVGRLFREFSITLAVAILISAVVSLTLTPMMAARLLKKKNSREEKESVWFEKLVKRYAAALEWVLDRQTATLWVALGTIALTALLYIVVPKGFFPVQDTGVIQAVTEAPQSASFQSMRQKQVELARALREDPSVASISSFIGVDGANVTLNSGRMLINLKPHSDRPGAPEVMRTLQQRAGEIEGITLYMQPVQDLTVEDHVSKTQYQFTLEAGSGAELSVWVNRLLEKLQTLSELADVTSDLQDQGLQAYVDIDRDTAARMGVTPAAVDNVLYNAYGQRLISTIFTQSNQYRVVLEVKPDFAKGPQAIAELYVPSVTGQQVPIGSIAKILERPSSLAINHLGQFPSTTVSFNLAPHASLGGAVKAIEAAERDIGMPESVRTSFQGAALAFRASLSNTLWLILAAVISHSVLESEARK